MNEQIYKIVAPGYVAGIIQGTARLSFWLLKVPEAKLKDLVVHSMTGVTSYPFDLVEFKMNGTTTFVACQDTSDTDGLMATLKGAGATVEAVYRIMKDFHGDPNKPGEDYMGVLDHVHF